MAHQPVTEFPSAEQKRANTYRLLAGCYHPPNRELYDLIDDAFSDPELAFAVDANALLDHLPESQQTLVHDHTQLFVGPFEIPAPPYGSVYLDDDRVMTASTTVVEGLYRDEGLDIGLDEPPDHIAAELEFLYVLVLGELEALNEQPAESLTYLKRQREFLHAHLGEWGPRFAANVIEHADTEFYRTLGELTASFLESDRDHVDAVLADIDNGPSRVRARLGGGD